MITSPQVAFRYRRSQVRSRRNDCVSGSKSRSVWGLYDDDRRVTANEEPPLGAHLITRRFAYAHHGIYVGAGTVVHYAALAHHWHWGPVEEVSLAGFSRGHSVWVRPAGPSALRCEEIVRRARSRVGEDHYRLLSNNCEHFSEWCVHAEHRSAQVERLLARPRSVSRVLSKLSHWVSAPFAVATRRRFHWHGLYRVLSACSPRAGTRSSAGNSSCRSLFLACRAHRASRREEDNSSDLLQELHAGLAPRLTAWCADH
jgi:hypothetical protein